jgi:hypothetical protein
LADQNERCRLPGVRTFDVREGVLFIITAEGRPIIVWGITTTRAVTPGASTALESLRSAVMAVHALPPLDPMPDLPEVPTDRSPSPPPGSRVVPAPIGRIYKMMLPGQLLGLAVGMVTFVGFQLALPWTFPWIILLAGVLFLLAFVVPSLLVIPRMRRVGAQGMVTVGNDRIGKRAGSQWLSISLSEIVGVGAYRTAASVGALGTARTWVDLRLVDAAGHRIDLDGLILNAEIVKVLKDATREVPTTDLALKVLTSA